MKKLSGFFSGNSLRLYLGVLALFSALAFAVYFPALSGPFVFDDIPFIRDNPAIRLDRLSAEGVLAAAKSRRPLTTLSFALNYYAAGYDTRGFHAVNVAFHALAAFLFFLLAEKTLALLARPWESPPETRAGPLPQGSPGRPRAAAFFAALLFLCHPLATESVSYISQRANVLCALFFILSLLFFAKGRTSQRRSARRLFFAACAASGFAALLSKENAATLPAFIFLYEWLFFRKGSFRWLTGRAFPIAWGLLLMAAAAAMAVGRGGVNPFFPALAILLVPVMIYVRVRPVKGRAGLSASLALTAMSALFVLAVWNETRPWAAILHEYKNFPPLTPFLRVTTELRVVVDYLGLYFWPAPGRLSISHYYSLAQSKWIFPGTINSTILIVCLLLAASMSMRRRPIFAFAVFMYFGNLVIESSIYPLHLAFEHRTYLPCLFLPILFTSALFRRVPRAAPFICFFLVILCCLFTFERNRVWADDLALWQDAVKKAPRQALARNNLGIAFFGRGRVDDARREFIIAVKDDPFALDPIYNLGLLFRSQGRLKDAETMFRKVLDIRDDYVFAHNDLGLTLMDEGRDREAEFQFKKALAWNPWFAAAMNNWGTLLLGRGDMAEAEKKFRDALAAAPGFTDARINLGVVLVRRGKAAEAVTVLRDAASRSPRNAEIYFQLGNALLNSGDSAEAVKALRRAISLDPQNPDARNSLAVAFTTQNRLIEAIVEYREALALMKRERAGGGRRDSLDGEEASVRKNLALALSRMKQWAAARKELEAARSLVPRDPDVLLGLGAVLAHEGLYAEARDVFAEAARLFPENPETHLNLGRVLLKLEKPHEALAELSQAAVLSPRDTAIYRDIARARDMMAQK